MSKMVIEMKRDNCAKCNKFNNEREILCPIGIVYTLGYCSKVNGYVKGDGKCHFFETKEREKMKENKSTHKAEVVQIKDIVAHPNADKMRIAKIFGWDCCIGIKQFKVGDLAVFIQPDSIVPPEKQYEFLKHESDGEDFPRRRRIIRVKKLRGVYSQGLLVEIPKGIDAKEGDDLADIMKIEHYDPETEEANNSGKSKGMGGEQEKGPDGYFPYYDVDNYNRFSNLLIDGEEIVAHEKIHGSNTLYTYKDGRFWTRSRNVWKRPCLEDMENMPSFLGSFSTVKIKFFKFLRSLVKEKKWYITPFLRRGIHSILKKRNIAVGDDNNWWLSLRKSPELQKFLMDNPGTIAFGEIYGRIQKGFGYGIPNDVQVSLFDIMKDGQWMSFEETEKIREEYNLPWCPIVYKGAFDQAKLRELAEGKSLMPNAENIREGIVVKPVKERTRSEGNRERVQLKMISNAYLER